MALVVSGPALAQEAPAPAPRPTRAGPAEALDLDTASKGFTIVGKEHLPDFTVFINRENLSKAYDLKLDEKFLPKIIDAVGKEPF
jgi:hypothetical protein